jgi:hypothetical protein
MNEWAMVLHPNNELAEMIGSFVSEQLPRVDIERVGTLEGARRLLRKHGEGSCRLIVAGMRAPRTPSERLPLDGSQLTTLEFVREIREGNDVLPVLLFASLDDPGRAIDVGELANVHVVGGGAGFVPALRAALKRMLGPAAEHQPLRSCVDLDIELHHGTYRWSLRRLSPPLEDAGALDVDRSKLEDVRGLLIEEDAPPRAGALAVVGRMLYKAVMAANTNRKGTRLAELFNQSCKLESARIRFNVDAYTHPILVEALTEPTEEGEEPNFWMLQAPIFRKYPRAGQRYPLFKDCASRKQPLDWLIIQGRLTDFHAPAPVNRDLPDIPLVAEEVDWLEDFLLTNRAKFGIGDVRVLRYPDEAKDDRPFAEQLKNVLAEKDWRVVHYAGHSAKSANGSGAFLVTGSEDSDIINVQDFAAWAKGGANSGRLVNGVEDAGPQFVFLSSCESADSYFVLQLVERMVPAVLGYRWPIGDSAARNFAECFYRHLFEDPDGNRYLEYAFMKAKRDLHKAHLGMSGARAMWAAPLLVMQLTQSEREPQLAVA